MKMWDSEDMQHVAARSSLETPIVTLDYWPDDYWFSAWEGEWKEGGAHFSLNGMKTGLTRWFIWRLQSRHCIVICNNKVFCLHGGNAWIEILDSHAVLYMEMSRTKEQPQCLK